MVDFPAALGPSTAMNSPRCWLEESIFRCFPGRLAAQVFQAAGTLGQLDEQPRRHQHGVGYELTGLVLPRLG
jgi:hypothetical protein